MATPLVTTVATRRPFFSRRSDTDTPDFFANPCFAFSGAFAGGPVGPLVAGREAEQDPSDNTASAATLVQGPFTPPSVCYSLRVTPRSLTVGRNSVIRVTVREAGKPVRAVRVVVTGKNLTKRARTNTAGVATIRFVPRRPGILQVRVPNHATCNRQRIGVVGVFTPPVTG